MSRSWILAALLGMTAGSALLAIAQERASASIATPERPAAASGPASHASSSSTITSAEESALRLEGEKRFRNNCGRCHQPPHKFSPRIMATAIRHMRVRAMLTEEDMRLILRYMTQ